MADIKISALPTATSVNDADIFVMDQGLVTKTATRAQILASIKDANNNISANAFFNNLASITASGTPVVLTVASAPVSLVTGSGGQVIKLPDATTLTNGTIFSFNNNQSSGAISVNNNSNTLVVSVPSGGYTTVVLLSNATAAGSWDRHDQTPANVSWSTNTFDYPGSITSATWNGNAVAVNRGGTGATTQAAALIALAAMATSERVNYIPTTQLGSLATTAQLAAITPASIGALSTAQAVTIGQGGTGQTTQQAALNAIAGAVTANQVLKGNGTNVVLGALTSADIPTLPIAKLSGVAASGANTDLTSVALTTGTVSTTPSGVTDLVNKAYADSIGSGINFHDACDYGTLAALSPTATYNQPGGAGVGVNATLTGQTNIALQVDGVTVAAGKRILVKNQASAFQNGVYNVTQQGDGSTVPYILTRAADYDTSGSGINEVQAGDFILILSSTLANTAWVQQTPAPINFGVTSISFTQFAAAASGVSSFNTSLTGLTPSTNTTGAVTLAGTLGVASGGTGSTSQAGALTNLGAQAVLTTAAPLALTAGGTGTTSAIGALTNLGAQAALTTAAPLALSVGGTGQTTAAAALTSLGAQPALTSAAPLAIANGGTGGINGDDAANNLGFPAQIRPVASNVNLGAGTNSGYVFTSGTTTPSFVAHSILTVGDNTLCSSAANTMNLGPWVVTTTGYQAVFVGTLASGSTSLNIVSVTSGTVAVGQAIVIPNSTNTITIASFGTFTVLAGTGTVNLSGSITTTQSNVTMASGTGITPVYTRPAWFRGTLPASSYYFQIAKSSSAATSQGNVYSIYPTSASESLPSVTANASGGTAWSNVVVSQRANNATTNANTFVGKQVLWAGSAGGNIPLAFQAGAIATTPVAHAVEWDGTQMYVTNSATERLPVATSKAQINAQTGTTYTPALTDAGYLITLSNAAAISVTIPTDASVAFPIGTQILLMQLLAGPVTVSAVTPGTTTVVGKNGLKTSGQYAVISLIKIAANSWIVAGDATV
jgi:hypothetical protein